MKSEPSVSWMAAPGTTLECRRTRGLVASLGSGRTEHIVFLLGVTFSGMAVERPWGSCAD
jgi:hypothetical protein